MQRVDCRLQTKGGDGDVATEFRPLRGLVAPFDYAQRERS